MQTIYLYSNGITPKNRFANATALNTFLSSQNRVSYIVEGCVITGNTGYFDIEVLADYGRTLEYSYILIANDSADQNSYCAFIDRVEFNNFNENKTYVRFYFTIDWWSTLLYQRVDLSAYIEGETERAHVNNFEPDANHDVKPTLEYTTNTIEEYTQRYAKFSASCGSNSNDLKNIRYTYIIISQKHLNTFLASWSISPIADKNSTTPYSVVVVPTQYGIVQPYAMTVYDETLGAYRAIEADAGGYPVASITDDSIIAMFDSNIPPINIDKIRRDDVTIVVGGISTTYANGVVFDVTNNTIVSILMNNLHKTIQFGTLEPHTFNVKDKVAESSIIQGSYPNVCFGDTVATIPQTYEEWLNADPKAGSYFYTPVCINTKGNSKIIDTVHGNKIIQIQNNLENGGIVVYQQTRTEPQSYSAISYVGEYSMYKPALQLDDIGMLSAVIGVGQTYANTMATVGGTLSETKAPANKVQAIGQGIETGGRFAWQSLQNQKAFLGVAKQAEGSTNGIPSNLEANYGTSIATIVVYVPLNILTIREHLCKYGYSTYLHPHEILSNHKRKYFNYIKTYGCVVTKTSYAQNIRADIEAMFNNGVWLWQTTDNFGNFEVPNYPIIMED